MLNIFRRKSEIERGTKIKELLRWIKQQFTREPDWCLHHWGAKCPNKTTNWSGYCNDCLEDWGRGYEYKVVVEKINKNKI